MTTAWVALSPKVEVVEIEYVKGDAFVPSSSVADTASQGPQLFDYGHVQTRRGLSTWRGTCRMRKQLIRGMVEIGLGKTIVEGG
ncbi:hypothetical protein HPP92_011442 [Vanilla planifolia]|uniref:Uncharacterized protein n=1 Tax=Vanilla planifolia TaxID=51239 RepID=A0A835R480_VANPL|nr:hypothetical protein HPP92_011442 [Vanilla planifolia]